MSSGFFFLFFQKFVDKFLQKHLSYQRTATAHVFLKLPPTESVAFFSKHISRTAILTQASVINCK